MENTVKKGKTVKTILNVVFYVFLVLVVLYSVLALFSTQDNNRTSVLGMSALTVQSNSMSPTFKEGDLIFIDTNFNVEDLAVGDVITYLMIVDTVDGPVQIYNSHRITEITVIDGVYWFTTQGDNTVTNPTEDANPVFQNDIIGVWGGTVWANVGTGLDSLITFLKSPTGFFLFIVLPVFAFLVYQAVRFIGIMTEYNTQKALGSRVSVEEEAIKIARAQIEAEMREKALKDQETKDQEAKK
ncbi:MAG: signal peptidase I [Candidatus Izemoplasmatales bacterium]